MQVFWNILSYISLWLILKLITVFYYYHLSIEEASLLPEILWHHPSAPKHAMSECTVVLPGQGITSTVAMR